MENSMSKLAVITDINGVNAIVNTDAIISITPEAYSKGWNLVMQDRMVYTIGSAQVCKLMHQAGILDITEQELEAKRMTSAAIIGSLGEGGPVQ